MHSSSRYRTSVSCSRPGDRSGVPTRLERCYRGGPLVLLALLARPVFSPSLGQEAVRASIAGAEAAQSRENWAGTPGYYNIHLGPTLWRFGAGLSLGYDDNIALTSQDAEGDWLYGPSVTGNLLWPLTEKQSLNLTLGAGYSGYIRHSKLNTAYISPNSEISFNIYAGDFLINLHDRFSISQNSYQDPTIAGSGSYSQFQNTVGVGATWDLNKLVISAGYDHANDLELTGGLGQPDQTSEILSASVGYTLHPQMLLGIEAGGATIHESAANTNTPYINATQWNTGVFFKSPVTPYLSVNIDAGYVVNSPQAGGALPTAQQFGGYYGRVVITHRLNRFIEYNLSGGRTLSASLFGGSVALYSANFSADWKICSKVSVDTGFNYYRGRQEIVGGETFDQYGPDISAGRVLTKKLSGSIRYQVLRRGSDLPGRDYVINVAMLTFGYQF